MTNMKYFTYKLCLNGVNYVYVIPENSKFLVDLQTGELIPKDEKLFEIMDKQKGGLFALLFFFIKHIFT